MLKFNHNQFYAAAKELTVNMANHNTNIEIIVSGAVALYFEHKFNTGYLEKAMLIARSHKGLRVNAVRSFLHHYTGVSIPLRSTGAKPLKKGKHESLDIPDTLVEVEEGEERPTLRQTFNGLDSWESWANDNAEEPTYNHKGVVLKLQKYLEKQKANAQEHNDGELAEQVGQMLKIVG